MPANALIQARIDANIKDRAAAVLGKMGLTVSDAVRMLLTRVANEGGLPAGLTVDLSVHDAWFRMKVHEALTDTRPAVSHDDVESLFAKRRAIAGKRARKGRG